ANLRAVVYRVDNPLSAAPSFVNVLDFPLSYQRNQTIRGGPGHFYEFCQGPFFCNWQPWPTAATFSGRAPTSVDNRVDTSPTTTAPFGNTRHPSYPLLSAITFAEDGSMILGFRDLIGDMGGLEVPGEIGAAGAGGHGPMARGDLLRAAANATGGGFTL